MAVSRSFRGRMGCPLPVSNRGSNRAGAQPQACPHLSWSTMLTELRAAPAWRIGVGTPDDARSLAPRAPRKLHDHLPVSDARAAIGAARTGTVAPALKAPCPAPPALPRHRFPTRCLPPPADALRHPDCDTVRRPALARSWASGTASMTSGATACRRRCSMAGSRCSARLPCSTPAARPGARCRRPAPSARRRLTRTLMLEQPALIRRPLLVRADGALAPRLGRKRLADWLAGA